MKSKYRLRSLKISNKIFHVGGETIDKANGLIEGWKFDEDEFKKDLFNFDYTPTPLHYPEIIPVPKHFCSNA